MELTTTATELFTGQILPTKANAETLGRAMAEDCRNGFSDLLETVAKCKAIMLAAETALSELEPEIIDEVAKHGKDGTTVLSSICIQPIEAGTKYNYASSGDPKWAQLKQVADAAAAELKERETFLKALKKPMDEVDIEGEGEVSHITPPVKTSKTTYKVTFLAA